MSTAAHVPLSSRPARRRSLYWYAPDRRIRTTSASRRATETVRRIRAGADLDDALDDHTLFVALHTCAYQMHRLWRTRQATPSRIRCWEHRWRLIRDHLIHQHLGLAFSMQARFHHGDHDRDELNSETMFALLRAVDRFNPWKGYRFSTYACNVIARALVNFCRRSAEARRRQHIPHQEWLDSGEPLVTESTDLYLERLRHTLRHNLGSLTEMEFRVLAQRFDPTRAHLATFREIAETIGLSKERVRQVQNRALRKLREAFNHDAMLK